jgi:hypothetical protein
MPPVLGPVSPSPTRLWSCAVPKGRAVLPSHRQKKLASSPCQEFLDHHFGAGLAERALETILDRRQRLVQRHRHGDALAGGQPVGLDDDRRALRPRIGLGLRRVVETLVGRRWECSRGRTDPW